MHYKHPLSLNPVSNKGVFDYLFLALRHFVNQFKLFQDEHLKPVDKSTIFAQNLLFNPNLKHYYYAKKINLYATI